MKDKSLYTTVTEALYRFSGLPDSDIVRNAASRGSVVHAICDAIAYNFPIDDEFINEMIREYAVVEPHFEKEKTLILSMVESFQRWAEGKKMFNKVPRFYDDDLMLTGECDFIYKNGKDQLTIVDVKTPINESHTWLLQGSAYSYLAKKAGYDIQCIEFIKLSRSGNDPKIFYYEENFPLYKSHLEVYRYGKDRVVENPLDYI